MWQPVREGRNFSPVSDDDDLAVVNHALAMITEQAKCSIADARQLLETRAEAVGQDLAYTAHLVIEREVSFDPVT